MSFDIASLAPTYELCWGSSGASNALDIAQASPFLLQTWSRWHGMTWSIQFKAK